MERDEFPSNSRKAKAQQGPKGGAKEVKAVVVNQTSVRKKGLGKRMSETFVEGDAQSVWGYVIFDVILPSAKDTIADAVSEAVHRMLFGEGRARSRSGSRGSGAFGRQGYHSAFEGSGSRRRERDRDSRDISRRARSQHETEEIVFQTRVEAETVLENMYELLSRYEVVALRDFYDLSDVTPEFTDEDYGWTDLRGSRVERLRGGRGYVIDLPRPERL